MGATLGRIINSASWVIKGQNETTEKPQVLVSESRSPSLSELSSASLVNARIKKRIRCERPNPNDAEGSMNSARKRTRTRYRKELAEAIFRVNLLMYLIWDYLPLNSLFAHCSSVHSSWYNRLLVPHCIDWEKFESLNGHSINFATDSRRYRSRLLIQSRIPQPPPLNVNNYFTTRSMNSVSLIVCTRLLGLVCTKWVGLCVFPFIELLSCLHYTHQLTIILPVTRPCVLGPSAHYFVYAEFCELDSLIELFSFHERLKELNFSSNKNQILIGHWNDGDQSAPQIESLRCCCERQIDISDGLAMRLPNLLRLELNTPHGLNGILFISGDFISTLAQLKLIESIIISGLSPNTLSVNSLR